MGLGYIWRKVRTLIPSIKKNEAGYSQFVEAERFHQRAIPLDSSHCSPRRTLALADMIPWRAPSDALECSPPLMSGEELVETHQPEELKLLSLR